MRRVIALPFASRSFVRRGVAIGATMCVAGVLLASPVAAARAPRCHVVNIDASTSYRVLHAAVDDAAAGDTLRVQGVCVGSTTVAKDLALVGKSNRGLGPATLDGDHAGRVLTIASGATVSITGLTITNGSASDGAGILNYGDLTLTSSRVTGNVAAGYGGGIANLYSGPARGELTTRDTKIDGNSAQSGGGAYVDSGTIGLYGTSEVSGNTAVDGGGIYCSVCYGVFLHDWSSIHNNIASRYGGGAYAGLGFFDLLGHSTLHHNTATSGGGVYQPVGWSGNIFTDHSPAFFDNVPDDYAYGIPGF